jgi:hypothetical protein
MTLEELDKFCVKYHLHKEMELDSSNSYMLLPAKLRYVGNQSIGIAVCNLFEPYLCFITFLHKVQNN